MPVTQDYKNVCISHDDWALILTAVSTRVSYCVEGASLAHGSPTVQQYWEDEAAEARAVRDRIGGM